MLTIRPWVMGHDFRRETSGEKPVNLTKYKQRQRILFRHFLLFSTTSNENLISSLKVKYLTVNSPLTVEGASCGKVSHWQRQIDCIILFILFIVTNKQISSKKWDFMSLERNFVVIEWSHSWFDPPNFGWQLFLMPWHVFPFQPTLIQFSFRDLKMIWSIIDTGPNG